MTGRRVAITGAARGIGYATAQRLIDQGAQVVIGDIDADLARDAAEALGARAHALSVDVTDPDSMQAFVDGAEELAGPLDVFVNNAGIMPTGAFLDEPLDSMRRQFDVNVFGVIHGLKAVLPRMVDRRSGHVINVASTMGKFGAPGVSAYCGTKHAVVGITDSLRAELDGTGVALSLVMPVIVQTELTAGIPKLRGIKTLTPEDVAASVTQAIETRRYEVWCPRPISGLYRAGNVLPAAVSDAVMKFTKTSHALSSGVDTADRQAYLDRLNAPESQR